MDYDKVELLRSTLFITIINDIIKEIRRKTKEKHVGWILEQVRISECAFEDDVIICVAQEKQL